MRASRDPRFRIKGSDIGASRIADTSGLDCIGIPTYSCVIPGTTDSIWVYSGKGLTRAKARLGAMLEGVERTSALWPKSELRVESQQSMLDSNNRICSPTCFTENLRKSFTTSVPMAWVLAERLGSCSPTWLPADLVFLGERPCNLPESVFDVSTSNGLACGFHRDEAILHGLLELIERHVVSLVDVNSGHGDWAMLRSIGELVSMDPAKLSERFVDDGRFAFEINTAMLTTSTRQILRRFKNAGVQVSLKQLATSMDLFVVGAGAVERANETEFLACAGYAADFTLDRAAQRSVLELAQSRATDLQGAREDCGVGEKGRWSLPLENWLFRDSEPSSFRRSVRNYRRDWTVRRRIDHCIEQLEASGMNDIYVVDFQSPAELKSVRVLCPGIETWHATAGDSRLGATLTKDRM